MKKLTKPEIVAAVDLGSNSFHMIVARLEEAGTLSIIDRLREVVRLGGGLTPNGNLDADAQQRALDCLERFGQRIRSLPPGAVRIVGTNTLRQARNAAAFVTAGETRLGHPIEIIAGREEARLIYLGVAHGHAPVEGKRLVVDIGGGSTELILGSGMENKRRESIGTGCVSATRKYFADGVINKTKMKKAIIDSRLRIYPIAQRFHANNWQEAIGCSGTIKAIHSIAQAQGWCENELTLKALQRIRYALVDNGDIERLELDGLKDDRKPVLAGGVAILTAVFKALDIERMIVSSHALREGVLYDLVGRIEHKDVRDTAVAAAMTRWQIDAEQAGRVTETATALFDMTEADWPLTPAHRQLLGWAARLHEIGLQVAHGGYHKHGAYILENADMPGFSRSEEAMLALLVLNHRRRARGSSFKRLQERDRDAGKRLCILLRIAVLLHRGRTPYPVPMLTLSANETQLTLGFPSGWLDEHMLTLADLESEQQYLEKIGFELRIS